ncbi:UDP-glucose:protein N-beta-glucosyltransferase [Basilea psittacipulmonis]|uniref:Adhesin n=1 Tax=Basilea psittacipulmonis DSM 24701 TaxID=1072685 RepID=A0A077DHE3_9BURK|nr:adhesin [Basilea psittacipulmonis]AIL32942.1 adhesin [Basilea psittacipulmonis DSM 24701]
MKKASVNRFEKEVDAKHYEQACKELFNILGELDNNFGSIANIEIDVPQQLSVLPTDTMVYFCTRVAVAITKLFQDPNLEITPAGARTFFTYHRWLSNIFSSSPFVNADHILRVFNVNPEPNDPDDIHIENSVKALIKFCILYTGESNVVLSLDKAWEIDPLTCASLCFALQSPRFIGTPGAFSKRAAILQWLSSNKLDAFPDLHLLPNGIIHDVYMHCSYDTAKNKHDVKKSLNHLIRRHLLSLGWEDRQNIKSLGYHQGKPVMLVLLEHFNTYHSIYRTHSTSIVAAKEHFHVIGMGDYNVDKAATHIFDEYYPLTHNDFYQNFEEIKALCESKGVAVLYMPSIGMHLYTIYASNTRLAPIQVVALGHPATTHSDYIEYVVVEDDYVGSEDCFSETLLRLPKDALPYVPSSALPKDIHIQLRERPEVVQIGIAATTMKINPQFLETLRIIRDRAKVKVHFHFALGQSTGIVHPYVERLIKTYLGDDAMAHPHKPYDQYLKILEQCDMMLNPFPFGNTNGIIDMVTLGLVGVCKTGDEVHEHIDEALFKRLKLPDWLVAKTIEQYIENAIYLAEHHEERLQLRKQIIENNGLKTLFTGDPRPLGQVLYAKLQEWAKDNKVTLASDSSEKPATSETSSTQASVEMDKGSAAMDKEGVVATKTTTKKSTGKRTSKRSKK